MKCHYSMEGQALRRLVDADIVNRKRERAVDTGEVQAEGVKHETGTETKEAVDTGIERATSLTRRAFCSDRDRGDGEVQAEGVKHETATK